MVRSLVFMSSVACFRWLLLLMMMLIVNVIFVLIFPVNTVFFVNPSVQRSNDVSNFLQFSLLTISLEPLLGPEVPACQPLQNITRQMKDRPAEMLNKWTFQTYRG